MEDNLDTVAKELTNSVALTTEKAIPKLKVLERSKLWWTDEI
jgi:hypothetical protein